MLDAIFNPTREGSIEIVALDDALARGREDEFPGRHLLDELMRRETAE